jgi:hypothetical protein
MWEVKAMTLTSATNQRIAIVCQHKRENPDSTFPDDRDLDAEVPGSGELIRRLGTIIEHHQQHKIRSGGTIGISYCRSHRSFAVHVGNGNHRYGYYTAKEAAAAYDAAAVARYGEDAVLNDPDAVDTLELDIRDKLLSTIP